MLKDITDRREAERRYRRERDFNRNILNNTQSMILVLDTAGLVSYANRRCFEAGYREQDLLGHPLVEDGAASAPRRCSLKRWNARCKAPRSTISKSRSFAATALTGQFSISLSPMRDEQGDINSVVVVMTDITDAANLQAKLMHTEKMAALGQLVSGVAHEVNNPLAAIVGFTDLLLENPAVPGRRQRRAASDPAGSPAHARDRAEPAEFRAPDARTARARASKYDSPANLKLRAYDFSKTTASS